MDEDDLKRKVWSVGSLTAELKRRLETGPLSAVFVTGEISGWKVYGSGHAYFALKDEDAILNAVMFSSALRACKARAALANGARVRLWGQLEIYPPRGSYQLIARQAWVDGAGELAARFEELKARLAAEGLFDPSRKKPLPFLPHRIGFVTSVSGAVIHDMRNVLDARFPNVEIRVWPAKVQGAGAAETIAAGVEYFNSAADWRADVIVVARGGGSAEDLWAFNEEAVVRAVAASGVPVVSAVGHETDFTLCDFAADARAGTPSIAAETIVPPKAELVRRLAELSRRLVRAPSHAGELFAQRTDHLERRLAEAPRAAFAAAAHRVDRAGARLALLDPAAVLARGYSITVRADGRVVRTARDAPPGAQISTRLGGGEIRSVVVE